MRALQILELTPDKRLFRLFSFLAPLAEPLIKRLEGAFEGRRGPDGYSCQALLFSLIAMYVAKIQNRAELVRRLKGDPRFAWVCGFEPFGKTPPESTFSRFFSKLSETSGLLGLFFELVKKGREMGPDLPIPMGRYRAIARWEGKNVQDLPIPMGLEAS